MEKSTNTRYLVEDVLIVNRQGSFYKWDGIEWNGMESDRLVFRCPLLDFGRRPQ